MRVRPWIAAGVFFAVLWVFVGGAALTPRSLLANATVGIAVGLPVAFVFRRLYEGEIAVRRRVRALPYGVLYVLIFVEETLLASLDVTYRVLAPGMPLEPQVILVPLRLETPLGVTTIANTISLTPGTVTLDHDPDRNALYVHGIDARHPEEIVEPIRKWENYALILFDEPASPSDPPPEITVHPPGYPTEPKPISDFWKSEIERDVERRTHREDDENGDDTTPASREDEGPNTDPDADDSAKSEPDTGDAETPASTDDESANPTSDEDDTGGDSGGR